MAKVFWAKYLFLAFPEQNQNILLLQCSTSGHHQILTVAQDVIYLEITWFSSQWMFDRRFKANVALATKNSVWKSLWPKGYVSLYIDIFQFNIEQMHCLGHFMSYSIIYLSIYINSWNFRNGRLSCIFLDVICGPCSGYVYVSFFISILISFLKPYSSKQNILFQLFLPGSLF